MVKAKIHTISFKKVFILTALLSVGLFIIAPGQAAAGVNRGPKNTYEQQRMNLCDTDPADFTSYGVVWINDEPTNAGGDARWSLDLVVPNDAGVVDATMWTTAYICSNGGTYSNIQLINLAPAQISELGLTFPYGNTIQRGSASVNQFTDPPGALRVSLDLRGKPSGTYTVAYSGRYSDNRGTGATNTYYTDVRVVRQPAPEPRWTLSGGSIIDLPQSKKGTVVKYSHDIVNLGPDTADGWGYRVQQKNYYPDNSTRFDGPTAIASQTPTSARLVANARFSPGPRTSSIVIPNDATPGSRFCQYIYYENQKRPLNGSPARGASREVCTTVVADNQTVDVCNNIDGDQATIPFPKVSDGNDGCIEPTGGGGPGGVPCPGDPEISANSKVTVSLPDQTPSNRTNAPSGTNTNSSETYMQAVPENKTAVTEVLDVSNPNTLGVSVALAVPSAGDQSYQSAKVDYAPFVSNTPYDLNRAAVKYDSYYTRTDWSKVFDRYQCDGAPASRNGSTCNYSYPALTSPTCASGFYFDGSCYSNGTSPTGTPATCGTKTNLWGTCYDSSTPGTYYYCNFPDSKDASNVCSGSYSATAYYRWKSGPSYRATVSNTVDAPKTMNACFPRDFRINATDTNTEQPTFANDAEDPDTIRVITNTSAEFSLKYGGRLRTQAQAKNIRYTGTYTVVRGDGSGEDPLYSKANNDVVNFDTGFATPTGPGWTAAANRDYDPVYEARIEPGKLRPGDRVCVVFTISPSGNQVTKDGNVVGGGSGTFTSNKSCSNPLANQPYVRMYGLDVSAGGVFATGTDGQCLGAGPLNGRILTNLKDGTRGAGSQYAAMARGSISNYASASLRSSAPTARDGLSFANTGSPGNFGDDHCIPDHTASFPGEISQNMNNGNGGGPGQSFQNLSFLNGPGNPAERQAFRSNIDTTLRMNGKGVRDGNRVSIFVDGDIYIEDDLTYRNSSWPDKRQIPSLTIISTGNIYIGKDVRTIDGVLIAQSNANGRGRIYTCAPPGFSTYSLNSLFSECNNQLVVNGALIAREVKFARTFASMRNAVNQEAPETDTFNPANVAKCAGNVRLGSRSPADVNHDCAAEIINFSPEMYLSEPAMNPTGGPATAKYDYITSLSPVL